MKALCGDVVACRGVGGTSVAHQSFWTTTTTDRSKRSGNAPWGSNSGAKARAILVRVVLVATAKKRSPGACGHTHTHAPTKTQLLLRNRELRPHVDTLYT